MVAIAIASEPPLGGEREGGAERRSRAGRPGEGEHDAERRLTQQSRRGQPFAQDVRDARDSGASARSMPAPSAGTIMMSPTRA